MVLVKVACNLDLGGVCPASLVSQGNENVSIEYFNEHNYTHLLCVVCNALTSHVMFAKPQIRMLFLDGDSLGFILSVNIYKNMEPK